MPIYLGTTLLKNCFKARKVCFFRLPSQPGRRQGGGRRAFLPVGTEVWSPSAGGTADSGDGRLRGAGGRGAGPGCAGGGGRGWGLAVTDGPDALECFRKGGALRRRRDFGQGVWCSADGQRALPQAPVPAAFPSGAPIAAERRQPGPGGDAQQPGRGARRQPAERVCLAWPAGEEDRLGSARRGEGETSGGRRAGPAGGGCWPRPPPRRFSPRRCSAG